MREKKLKYPVEKVCESLQDQKSGTLKRVEKRMLQWPLGTAGGRSNSRYTVMRESIPTSIAQGDLCWEPQHQNFGTSNTRTINTWARSFSFCKSRNVGKLTQVSRWKHTEQVFSYGEWSCLDDASRHPSWAMLHDEFGDLQEHKKSRILRVCSTLLKSWWGNILKKLWMWNGWNIHHRLGWDQCRLMTNQSNGRRRRPKCWSM